MRLIDADRLHDMVFKSRLTNPHANGIAHKIHNDEHNHFILMIDEQPTAYDVEAVIKELFNSAQSIYGTNIIRMEDAIEIVKRGGRNGV